MDDKTIFRETSVTRRVTFRWDNYGLYLLFWQGDSVCAGITYQHPSMAGDHLVPGLSLFSFLPLDFVTASKVEKNVW